MNEIDFKKKKLEYLSAEKMLCHYDSLNWQIGSILIAATILFTGLMLQRETIYLLKNATPLLGWVIAFSVPLLSLFILGIWLLWFRRHRDLYNFRNETLHRLELELGFYHFLNIVEIDFSSKPNLNSQDKQKLEKLITAKKKAGYFGDYFVPFYDLRLSGPSGYNLAKILTFGIPLFQLILFIMIKLA